MMPLLFAELNERKVIKRISGNAEIKHHLENLGFVPGSSIRVVNKTLGNMIVDIKDVRVAIAKDLARKIMV